MRIDSHQHFIVYSKEEYPWITDELSILRGSFMPDDLSPLLKQLSFDGSIAVQARESIEDTQWLLQLAEQYPLIKGVVGWFDLCSADVEKDLERLSEHPLLKGVRMILQAQSEDYLLREDFQRGLGLLSKYDLTYDLLLLPKHLPNALKLVEKFPEQPFVLDHISKPDIKESVLSPWREYIQALAKQPHVMCKLSGMVTEAAWGAWKPEDFHAYLDVVLEAFGPERLMIGSDWPVCKLSGEYEEVMEIVMNYIQRLSKSEQEMILGLNCARFYAVK
jgi:L-fuconolactonase